jgi:nucleotide-binding universal stress UspA family protein
VADGPLLQAIGTAAHDLEADLLVLGARGASTLRHFVLGTTAARLVDTFTRPLLVVKRPALAEYRSVLVPVDFSEASLPALQLARAVAPRARLVLLHAYQAPFEGKLRVAGVEDQYLQEYRDHALAEAQEQMGDLCERAGLPRHGSYQVFAHGPAVRSILEQEDDQDADLVVVGRQGQSRIEDMLLGSVSRRVLAEADADVLVLP